MVSWTPPRRSVHATSRAALRPPLPWGAHEAAPQCISGRTSYLRVRLAFHPYPQVIPPVCNPDGFGPPRACSARFTLPMGSSPGFGSPARHLSALSDSRSLRLRLLPGLASPPDVTRRLILQKARRHPLLRLVSQGRGSDRPGAHGFRLSFTPLAGVLFTVPSRYWSTIGRRPYLALGRGRPRFPPGSSCPAVLTVTRHPRPPVVAYGTLTPSGRPFQRRSADCGPAGEGSVAPSADPVLPPRGSADRLVRRGGLGSSRFARRYSGNPLFSSGY